MPQVEEKELEKRKKKREGQKLPAQLRAARIGRGKLELGLKLSGVGPPKLESEVPL